MSWRVLSLGVVHRSRAQLVAVLLVAGTACGQATPRGETRFDTALVNEQKRRIASFDSVVRSINTDSAYRLWQRTLVAPDAKLAQRDVECEYDHLMYRYGINAAGRAIRRMEDTLWRHADPALVTTLHERLRGESLAIGRGTCGPPPSERAPYWLQHWQVYDLPELPPSPTDSAPRDLPRR